jgi:hypothetical protein
MTLEDPRRPSRASPSKSTGGVAVPIDDSVPHLWLVGSRLMLRHPEAERLIPMSDGAFDLMCAELEASGRGDEAARHQEEMARLRAIAQHMAAEDRNGTEGP